MSSLLMTLPPLSPDYSGVASTMHDLGALTVIHDASGCTGTYAGYDEPRWFGGHRPVFCSGLREMDATMGDDDKLLAKIEAFLEDFSPPFVSVIGSPVPMVVGFDFEGFCTLVESRTGIAAIGFPTNGLSNYDAGQAMAYAALEKRFVADGKRRGGFNVLGASPLDDIDGASIDYVAWLGAKAGLELVSVWGSRSDLSDLSLSAAAAVNWVTAASAIPLAKRLRARFGTPYVVGLPIGASEERRLTAELEAMASKASAPPEPYLPKPIDSSFPTRPRFGAGAADPVGGLQPGTTVVVAEAVCAASIAACMRSDIGAAPVLACSLFGIGEASASAGVIGLRSESELAALLAAPEVERLIGDPLLARLAPATKALKLMPLPHRAISARLYRDSRSRLFGGRGVSIFEAFLGGKHA